MSGSAEEVPVGRTPTVRGRGWRFWGNKIGDHRAQSKSQGGHPQPEESFRELCAALSSRDVEKEPSRASLEGGENVGNFPTDGGGYTPRV